MFCGIIEQVGQVTSVASEGLALRLTLQSGFDDLVLGESVAVNGVCLTVVSHNPRGQAEFFVSSETLNRSNLATAGVGARVNLERSLTLTTRLSGHLVQGHVDGKARLSAVEGDGEAWRVELTLPNDLHPFCVEKGSIALNGVSLTLNAVGAGGPAGATVADGRFVIGLTLIPHTWAHTNLQHCVLGDEINVEVDVLAKYVERLCHAYLSRSTG